MHSRPVRYREDDSHDILGTYRAILESRSNANIPTTFAAFMGLVRHWNRLVIESRHDKRPGELKTQSNQAGNTVFGAPELVLGTLEKADHGGATPGNCAALAMFVVAEVHPFTDGNGRTTRMAMNAFLSQAGLTRIIIPTVYRDDYLTALKAMSSTAHPVPLGRMLARAARFSRWVNMSSREACFAALRSSNALARPQDAKLTFDDESPRA